MDPEESQKPDPFNLNDLRKFMEADTADKKGNEDIVEAELPEEAAADEEAPEEVISEEEIPEEEIPEEEIPEEVKAQVEAAISALLADPFPQSPYALVTSDSNEEREFRDFVIHKDIESENQCVFVFDSIVDAFAVAEEYKEATGREAEPVECDVFSLDEDRFWVKFYRANGVVAMMSLQDYKQNVDLTRE